MCWTGNGAFPPAYPLRAGLVNSAGEAPTLISTERDPNNHNVKIERAQPAQLLLRMVFATDEAALS